LLASNSCLGESPGSGPNSRGLRAVEGFMVRRVFLTKRWGCCPGLDGNLSSPATESLSNQNMIPKFPVLGWHEFAANTGLKNRICRLPIMHWSPYCVRSIPIVLLPRTPHRCSRPRLQPSSWQSRFASLRRQIVGSSWRVNRLSSCIKLKLGPRSPQKLC